MDLSTHTRSYSAPMMAPQANSTLATSAFSRPYIGPSASHATTFGAKPPNFKKLVENGKTLFEKFKNGFKALVHGFKMLRNKDTRRLGLALLFTYALPVVLTAGALGTAFTSLLGVPIAVWAGSRIFKNMDEEINLMKELHPKGNEAVKLTRNELTTKYRHILKRFKLDSEPDIGKIKEKIKFTGAHRVRDLMNTLMSKVNGKADDVKDALRSFNDSIDEFFGKGQNKTLHHIFHLGEEGGKKFTRWEALINTRNTYMKSNWSLLSRWGQKVMKWKIPVVSPLIGFTFLVGSNIVFALKHGKGIWHALRGTAGKAAV